MTQTNEMPFADRIRNTQDELWRTPPSKSVDKMFLCRAYAISACELYLSKQWTGYHYPMYFLLKHSLELGLKWHNNRWGHSLKDIIEGSNRLDKDQIDTIDWFERLEFDNDGKYKADLRYEERGDHKQFPPELFLKGLDIVKQLILDANYGLTDTV